VSGSEFNLVFLCRSIYGTVQHRTVRTMTDSKSDAAGEEDEKEKEGEMGAPRNRRGCGLMVLLVPESMAASASLLVLYLRMTEGVASSSMMSVISPNFWKRNNS
jgi:hypothetical protein